MLELHRAGHIYVSASRGEGFGLGAVEAALYGHPVIGTGPWMDTSLDCFIRGPYREIPVTPLPESPGYTLEQSWYDIDQRWLSETIKSTVDKILKGELDLRETAEKVEATYSPRAISELIKPRLLHVKDLLK
jgi:hypothetical protein